MFKVFGEAPREFNKELLYTMGKKKMPFLGGKKLKARLENGHFLRAGVVQVENTFHADQDSDYFTCVLLYSLDGEAKYDKEALKEIVLKLRELRDGGAKSEDEIEIANYLSDSSSYFYHVEVPKSLTNGKKYFVGRDSIKPSFCETNQRGEDVAIADYLVELYYIREKEKANIYQINVPKYLKLK